MSQRNPGRRGNYGGDDDGGSDGGSDDSGGETSGDGRSRSGIGSGVSGQPGGDAGDDDGGGGGTGGGDGRSRSGIGSGVRGQPGGTAGDDDGGGGGTGGDGRSRSGIGSGVRGQPGTPTDADPGGTRSRGRSRSGIDSGVRGQPGGGPPGYSGDPNPEGGFGENVPTRARGQARDLRERASNQIRGAVGPEDIRISFDEGSGRLTAAVAPSGVRELAARGNEYVDPSDVALEEGADGYDVTLSEDARLDAAAGESEYGRDELTTDQGGEVVLTGQAQEQRQLEVAANEWGVSTDDVEIAPSGTGTSPVAGETAPRGAREVRLTDEGLQEYVAESSEDVAGIETVQVEDTPEGRVVTIDDPSRDGGGVVSEVTAGTPVSGAFERAGDAFEPIAQEAAEDVVPDSVEAGLLYADARYGVDRAGTAREQLDAFEEGVGRGINLPRAGADLAYAGEAAAYATGIPEGTPDNVVQNLQTVGEAGYVVGERAVQEARRNPVRTAGAAVGGAAVSTGAWQGTAVAARSAGSAARSGARAVRARTPDAPAQRLREGVRRGAEDVGSTLRLGELRSDVRGTAQLTGRTESRGFDGSMAENLRQFELAERSRRASRRAEQDVQRTREQRQTRRQSPQWEGGRPVSQTVDNRPGGDYTATRPGGDYTVSRGAAATQRRSQSGPTQTETAAWRSSDYEAPSGTSSVERYVQSQSAADDAVAEAAASGSRGGATEAVGLLTLAQQPQVTAESDLDASSENLYAGVDERAGAGALGAAQSPSLAEEALGEMGQVSQGAEVTADADDVFAGTSAGPDEDIRSRPDTGTGSRADTRTDTRQEQRQQQGQTGQGTPAPANQTPGDPRDGTGDIPTPPPGQTPGDDPFETPGPGGWRFRVPGIELPEFGGPEGTDPLSTEVAAQEWESPVASAEEVLASEPRTSELDEEFWRL